MLIRAFIVFVCLIIGAGAVARADRYEQPPDRTRFSAFPMMLGDWRGMQNPPFTDRVLEVLGVDDYLSRAYVTPDRTAVDLYMGYWGSQRTGDTIHSPLNCLPGAGWEPISQTRMTIPGVEASRGATASINRVVIQKGIERQLVLYWYQSHGRIVASEYWGKVYMVVDAVRLNRTDGAIVRIVSPIVGEGADAESQAEQRAVRFATTLMPTLGPFLPS